MGLLTKLIFLFASVFVIFTGILVYQILEVPPTPDLKDTWWGPGQSTDHDASITPFKISVPKEVITDLKHRLNNARPFIPPLEGTQQQYGMNTKLLSEIVDFWKTKYNWSEREDFLNKYPQFMTNIQGLKIHFIHVKPAVTTGVRVVPLLLLHGWPGSVREFYEIIPLLTKPQKGQDFVFEVIVPSLPGYGFSDAATKPGLGAAQMAVLFNNLMKRLGFHKYYLQGGDWGALIGSNMAVLYPDNVLGVHSNMCFVDAPIVTLKTIIGSVYPPLIIGKEFESRMYPLSTFFSNLLLEFGYMHIQSTKPDTVGVGLNDSPVGLAAYILEKFTTWTNPEWKNRSDGGLREKYSYVDLLDNVMIYWVTGSITTSVRLYSESMNKAQLALKMSSIPINVPSACAKFKHELGYQPDSLLVHKYKHLVQSTDISDGGHFAAFEVPVALAGDIWSAVSKMENYHKSR